MKYTTLPMPTLLVVDDDTAARYALGRTFQSRYRVVEAASVAQARERLRLWDITEAQIRAVEASGKPIRTLTLYSPISGYIIQKMVVQGMRVMPGERLFGQAEPEHSGMPA